MRSTWWVLAALGALAVGCGMAQASDEKPGASPGLSGAGGWLTGEDPGGMPSAEGPEGWESAKTSPPGSGGSGGASSNVAPDLATLCPGYSPSQHAHVLVASTPGPGHTASAQRARKGLLAGVAPVAGSVRQRDFINLFAETYGDAPPAKPLEAEMALRPRTVSDHVVPTQFDLYVGVTAGAVTRPKVFLTLLVDSTLTAEEIETTRAVLNGLEKGLNPGDRVTILSADPSVAAVELQMPTETQLSTLAPQFATGAGSIGTRLPEALSRARQAPQGTWSRVVVLSDGQESWQSVNPDLVTAAATESQVFTTTIGVSADPGAGDAFLYRIARAGRGRYLYADSDITKLLHEHFDQLFGVAADKLRVRVDLPSYMYPLDAETPGSTDGAQDVYLGPGETWQFLFRVGMCSDAVISSAQALTEKLVLSVVAQGFDGNPLTASRELIPSSNTVVQTHQHLDRLLGIEAFVEALKYPEQTRFKAARTQLEALKAKNDSLGTELLDLLSKHPASPP